MTSVYDFSAQTLTGKPRKMSEFKGHVLLVVNTASKCGFTPQYAGLEARCLCFRVMTTETVLVDDRFLRGDIGTRIGTRPLDLRDSRERSGTDDPSQHSEPQSGQRPSYDHVARPVSANSR